MIASPFLGLMPRRFGLSENLSADIELVDTMLGRVLCAQEDEELLTIARSLFTQGDDDPHTLIARMPRLREPRVVLRLLRAYTVLFQLVNTAEQKEIVRVNRERASQSMDSPRAEAIAEAVQSLHDAGATAEEVQAALDRLEVTPTLTAHPTEARRRSVLDKLQAIAAALVERSVPPEVPLLDRPLNAPGSNDRAVESELTALWQTDELRANPLTVTDEVTNTLYFFERSIFDVVAWLHDDLRRALARSYPGAAFRVAPFLRYGSWVGGDRDGNPNVTPDITWQTLLRHKTRILDHYIAATDALRRELSMSARLVAFSRELEASLAADAQRITLTAGQFQRYQVEPYGLKLVYIHERLLATRSRVQRFQDFRTPAESLQTPAGVYESAEELEADLCLIQRSLRENGGSVIADEGLLAHLVAQARAFGFHLATLDIRQHSDEHGRALGEMLRAAGLLEAGVQYNDLPEEEKMRVLQRELVNPRPLLARDAVISDSARNVLDVFHAVREAQRHLSPRAVTAYIISMTHGTSDILEVLLLAKEAGLLRWTRDAAGLVLGSDIDVVPLFETIEDLERCDGLMRGLFADPAYRAHLTARAGFQEIMLGYSDSSKDGGFLAANWTTYATQSRLADACREAGVEVRFFHGRGGTVGRGGGRANRAILSQPPGSFSGRIRFTEQGEVISFRYGVRPLAHRHMEQIVSAALLASSARTAQPAVRDEWRAAMHAMGVTSLGIYRALTHDNADFWRFFTQATPIKYISRLPIASRPASRSRTLSGLDALRAIPWVFAWVQSRYVVPGWYGLGTALRNFAQDAPERIRVLTSMYKDWLFFRMVINNAQLELLRAHLPTAEWYARRVDPPELGARMHDVIAREHALSCEWILRITEQSDLLEHAPVVRRTVELRNPALRPLSKLQIAVLDVLEREEAEGASGDTLWHQAMLLSIIGIAAGMQSTG